MNETGQAEGGPSASSAEDRLWPVVDEALSYTPFFEVYTYPDEAAIGKSLERSIASTHEVIIAKLFATDIMGNSKLLIFTNYGLIVLALSVGVRQVFWRMVGLVEKIPVIGWLLSIVTEMLQSLLDNVLATNYKHAERLVSVPDATVLETRHSKKKVMKLAKGIYGSWKPYSERLREFRPSVGISLQYRNFAYVLGKIRVTTLRVLPVGRWLEAASAMGALPNTPCPGERHCQKSAKSCGPCRIMFRCWT